MSIIHNLLEDVVKSQDGPAQLAKVRAIASEQPGIDTAAKVVAFVTALAESRRKPANETFRTVTADVVPLVLRAFPILIRANKSTMSLLMHLNQVAPATLDAVAPGVVAPDFDVELLGTESIRLRFSGDDAMAAVVEGVALGAARHFGEEAQCVWGTSASSLPDRRVLEVQIAAPRRPMSATPR